QLRCGLSLDRPEQSLGQAFASRPHVFMNDVELVAKYGKICEELFGDNIDIAPHDGAHILQACLNGQYRAARSAYSTRAVDQPVRRGALQHQVSDGDPDLLDRA